MHEITVLDSGLFSVTNPDEVSAVTLIISKQEITHANRTNFLSEEENHSVNLSGNIFYSELKKILTDIRDPLLPPEIADRIYAFTVLGILSQNRNNPGITKPRDIINL